MAACTDAEIDLGRLGWRRIQADFSGADLSSDGELLLSHQIERLGQDPCCVGRQRP